MRKLLLASGLFLAAAGLGAQAHAQDWPTDSIKLIVPFSPGGAVDFTARLLQEQLSNSLGVDVVVENLAGGATIPATEALIHSPADGSTIELIASAFVTNSVLLPDVPYDPTSDVTPISRVVKNTTLVVVQPDSPWNSIGDMIEAAKADPGGISYLTPGFGTAQHLAATLLQMEAGIELNHVPYKGAGPALNDMLGGQAPLAFLGIGPTHPNVKSGKLKAIGLTSAERSPALPDVKTIAEQGFPDYSYGEWFAVVAPKGLPQDLVDRLYEALKAAAESEDYSSRLTELGLEAEATTPDEFAQFIASERERITDIATKGDMLPK